MPERPPSDEWVEAANCLATVADTLSSAVHEANNMLQVITGSAEMIQMHGGLPPSVIKRTEIISAHAQRVSALIGALRDLSKARRSSPRVSEPSTCRRSPRSRDTDARHSRRGYRHRLRYGRLPV